VILSNQEKSYAFDHPTHPKKIIVELIGEGNIYLGMVEADLTHAESLELKIIDLPE